MANFLRDYINQRGENTVILTQYGIQDNKTGEHLVPVKNPFQYFEDGYFEVERKPNTGMPVKKGSEEPIEPVENEEFTVVHEGQPVTNADIKITHGATNNDD